MAHSPKMLTDSLESAKLPPTFPSGQTVSTIVPDTSVSTVSSALADQGIEGTELALDLILHDIAERARQATGASGAAIAILQEEAMVCRAAAGATAPDLGARINTQFGLSGACVRSGETQWCNDSDADERVDAEACRALAIRSLVVVPVFARDSLVGVFEVFSPKPQAFREQDMHTLQDLAQWVTEAVQGASGTAAARQQGLAVVGAASSVVPRSQLPSRSGAYTFFSRTGAFDPRNRILSVGTALLALVLCSMLAFRWGWQKAHSGRPVATQAHSAQTGAPSQGETRQPQSTSKSVTPTNTEPFANRALSPKPDAGKLRGGLTVYEKGSVIYQQVPRPIEAQNIRPNQTLSSPGLSSSAEKKSESSPPAGQSENAPQGNDDAVQAASSSTGASGNPIMPPAVAAVRTDVSESAATTVVRVSQGVKEGRLIRRVDPKYPTAALLQRVEGSVVLQALIGKDGRVHEMKAANGHSYLTQAALEAVRQWVYEPYTLNGEPIDMKTEITVKFKLPNN
jgi:TonB family protein